MSANKFAVLLVVGQRHVVTSGSQQGETAIIRDNGHAEMLDEATPGTVGAAIRRAWEASGRPPVLKGGDALDNSVASITLGYPSFVSMMNAGARAVEVSIVNGELFIDATENLGRGFNTITTLSPPKSTAPTKNSARPSWTPSR